MNASPVFTAPTDVLSLLFLALIAGAVIAGIMAAIRHGYTHAAAAIGVFAGVCVVAMYYLRSHPAEQHQSLGLLLVGGLFVVSQLGLGYILRDGAQKAKLVTGGMCLGVVGIAAAMALVGVQRSREEVRRAQIQNDLRQMGHSHHTTQLTGLSTTPLLMDNNIMHAQSQIQLSTVAMGVSILILLAIVIGIVAAIRHGKIVHLLAGLAVVGILFFMTAFAWVKVQQPRTTGDRRPVPAVVNPSGPPTLLDATASSLGTPTTPIVSPPGKIQYITGNAAPIELSELPSWRKNPPREGSIEQGWSKYVLTSGQFATVEEAEAELFQTLTADVQLGFAHHWPQTNGWVPTRDDIVLSGLISERVIETNTIQVGEFVNPVHRVSWLVEFKSETNKALHARWQPLEAERRSKLILSILAGVSGVMGMAAMLLRRRKAMSEPTPQQATA